MDSFYFKMLIAKVLFLGKQHAKNKKQYCEIHSNHLVVKVNPCNEARIARLK
jgi:hypothetical protein